MRKITCFLTILTLLVTVNMFSQAGCAGVVLLTPGTQQCGNTSEGGDTNSSNPCLGNYDGGDDYLFYYVASETGETLSFVLTGHDDWTGFGLTSGCPESGTATCMGYATTIGTEDITFDSDPLVAGETYYLQISTWPSPQSTDFCLTTTLIPAPTCLDPENFMASNLTTTSVDLSWTANPSTQNDFEYVIQAAGTGEPTANGVAVSGTSVSETSLNENTTYEAYVRANCGGGDYSAWVGPITFTTLCSTFVAPWSYDVETAASTTNSSIADCWSSNPAGNSSSFRWDVDGSGSTPSTSTGPSGAFSGSKYFYTEASSGSTGDVAELYTPNVDISGLTTPVVQFYYHMYGSTMGELHVDVFDGTTWTNDIDVIIGEQQIDGADPWLQRIVSLSGYTGVVQVRFRGIRGTDYYGDMSLDDIEITEAPSCYTPLDLAVGNITYNSVYLSWTDPSGVQNDFEYVIQPVGTGVPTGAGTAVSGFSVTDSSLAPDTDYEVYVRANCGGGDYSEWANPVTFTTSCAPAVAPWLYDVESASTTTSSSIADCWESNPTGTSSLFRWNVDGSGSTPSSLTGPSGAYSGTNYFYTEATSGLAGDVAELYTPFVDVSALTSPAVQFYYHMYGSTMGDLHVDIFDGTTWTNDLEVISGEQQTAETDLWEFKAVDLSGYTGIIRLRFRAVRGTDSYGDMALDNIEVTEMPTCIPPSNFTVSNVLASEAQLNWVDPTGFQYDFEYVIQPQGTGVPTGNGTTVSSSFTVTDNSLNSNTAYEAYIRADCGGSYSVWVGPINFDTPCNPYTIPYFEGFESGYADATTVAGCLYQESLSGSGVWTANTSATSYNRTPRTGSWNAYLGYSNEDWLFIPVELIGGTSYTVDLYARQDGANAANADIAISYGLNPDDASMTNAIVAATGIVNGDYQQIQGNFTPSADGVYYVGIKGNINSAPWYISLDDISIDLTPACQPPFSVVVSNITDTTADFTWGATTGNYEYVLDNSATDPTGAGTPISGESYNETSLTPETTYYFHVRTDCGSDWVTISFTTTAVPPANDECDNAVALTVNADYSCAVVTSATNEAATDSGIEPTFSVSGTPDNDVWFSFVATSTQHRITLSNIVGVVGTSTDMGMAVFDGTSGCSALSLIGSSDPNTYDVTGLTIGNTYLVAVYGWSSTNTEQTTFDICVGTQPPAPANDSCSTAIEITSLPYTNSQDALGATNNAGMVTACGSGMNDGVWYTVVGNGSDITIELTNMSYWDAEIGVYTGSCGTFTCVGNADSNSSGTGETYTITGSTLGETYYINIGHYSSFSDSSEGQFTIDVTSTLSNATFDNEAQFVAYPNPVNDILNLEYEATIDEVRVLNLLGQEVFAKKINATSAKIDMTSLSSGTYIVNVQAGDLIKTIKVIKQ
ncbi:fibronectin type III domain-containing protein [Flavobacterium sp. NRK F10]|uniref:fibronectin type III domain-containing protein n=1 Tax=Flavobacterium sp. NRK F10 TaxID=2954931 RepID=UPI0020904507|nr:fibronectin type III domain-containing protein [Flavobacterium sp. NRK F10]MCO6175773.1 fibronectin type III domain-containing protein [Flavobacterium sp. NRK F10]